MRALPFGKMGEGNQYLYDSFGIYFWVRNYV